MSFSRRIEWYSLRKSFALLRDVALMDAREYGVCTEPAARIAIPDAKQTTAATTRSHHGDTSHYSAAKSRSLLWHF